MDIDNETVQLRKDLARNEKLALEISELLSQYQFDVPDGKIVVWGPMVLDKPDYIWDVYHLLINGIPHPDYLRTVLRFDKQFRI